jgi:Porin subfamily
MRLGATAAVTAAACFVAGGNNSRAADLPLKARAVEYVRVCSLYGAGFWYIPGTDTCIKIGGYFRVETTFAGTCPVDVPAWNRDPGKHNRFADYFSTRSRMTLDVDTQTATEYGLVRTFAESSYLFDTLGSSTVNPLIVGAAPAPPTGIDPSVLDGVGGGYVSVDLAFIQFAGFTFGKSASVYATPWVGFPGNTTANLMGGENYSTAVNNIQYTAEFGNGVTASVGLDDPSVADRTSVLNLSVAGSAIGPGAFAYGGTHAPDVVGRVRANQDWGMFQIPAAAHEVDASYNNLGAVGAPTNLSEISGHPDTKWGGSVMAALQIRHLPTGPGDDVKVEGTWASGDTRHVISGAGPLPSFAIFGGSNRGYESIGFGQTSDAVYLPKGLAAGGNGVAGPGGTGDIKLVDAFGVRSAFNHNWDPYWSSVLFGAVSAIRFNGNATDLTSAKGQWCASYIASNKLTAANTSADFSCNPDFNVFQVGLLTRWTPVKGLTFSAEAMCIRLDQNFTGTAVLSPAPPKPATVYEFKDQSAASLHVRVQRVRFRCSCAVAKKR